MAGELIVIDGGRTSIAIAVDDNEMVHQLGLGPFEDVAIAPAFPIVLYPLLLPTFGEEVAREPALRVTHGDGATSTRLVFRSASTEHHAGGSLHRLELADRVAPLRVTICWRAWPAYDLVEQWTEVSNVGDAPCTLHQAASAAPAFGATDPWFTHWGGGWANEWNERTEQLGPGTKTVASAGGVRPSLHLPPVVVCAPGGVASETTGSVLLATVLWGGDTRFDAEVAPLRQGRLIAGIQHRGAERILDPGGSFSTPPALLAWSPDGVGPISRSLHRFVREQVVRDGGRIRSTVFNNWEAMGFSLGNQAIEAVVDGAADIGAEVFLLDDGWFGSTHPRNDDTQGLGDWEVDLTKLPDGLDPIIVHTLGRGLRFGLWVEPEMVNPRSALAESHPEWVIGEPGREPRLERHQLVLDLCRPEVQAFVVDMIDRVLAAHPDISYLKWDANRDITEPGSATLPADRQSHLPVDRVDATAAVMAEVARRHGDVELMLCASGGGRSDLASLRWFHEVWTSDNTDPVDRVRIQWGASHLLPANVLASHVTRWGMRPVPFACAVAMSARFGFDIDPRHLTDEERVVAAAAAASYHRIRDLVQQGELHRLVSPIGSAHGALAYVAGAADTDGSSDGSGDGSGDDRGAVAVVFAFLLDDGDGQGGETVVTPFIGDEGRYVVRDLTPGGPTSGTVVHVTAEQLRAGVLAWPAGPAPSAAVWLISREEAAAAGSGRA